MRYCTQKWADVGCIHAETDEVIRNSIGLFSGGDSEQVLGGVPALIWAK